MPTPAQIRQEVTNRIIAALEAGAGTVPWKRPWTLSKNSGRPANAVSGRNYSGINVLLTELHRLRYGFSSRWFLTYSQAKALGGNVKKRPDDVPPGEWGCRVVFFRPIEKSVVNKATGEEELRQFPLLRTYSVFGIDQVEGEALDRFRVLDEPDSGESEPDFEPAEQLIDGSGADIRYGGDRAFYVRPQTDGGDYIQMPQRKRFVSLGTFYETLLHEMGHWCESRTGFAEEGHGYAMGELIAEITASFVSAELRIPNGESLDNHVAYLKSWLAAMKGDSTYIFKACSWASKASDLLLSFVPQQKPTDASPAAEDVAA